ncbi:MAG TPA: alanine--tRNA ligase, partial [Leptospiraceae bacterium]|nr:alanine--tRNA ligase [Leptospiraceae bacterium]
ELYLDRGVSKGYEGCGTKESCRPGCSCDRFLEYWNLVFNQFNQDTSGVLHPLKQTGIDTGSGLERVALLSQNVDSVYDTDQLQNIIKYIEKHTKDAYSKNPAPFRVLTDHSRSVTFAIGDGILPDKTGRGYVIRRLIRRAVLYAGKIGIREPFLFRLAEYVSEIYKEDYPELSKNIGYISSVIFNEEKLFLHTLEVGISQMEEILESYRKENKKLFLGRDIFRLYGTYGFPPEMTKEIVQEKGFVFDEKGYEEELEKDRTLSRESWKGKKANALGSLSTEKLEPTVFTGYTELKTEGKVLYILKEEKSVQSVSAGDACALILDRTSFYGESGGQIGDTGFLKKDKFLFKVTDTQKENDVIIHIGTVLEGSAAKGDALTGEVETERRALLTYHHSGTHLLHAALRKALGTHVSQKASLVSNEYLRFDFSHPKQMTEKEILEVEQAVNSAVSAGAKVKTEVLDIESAKKTGAMAFFEDKYGDRVRVVSMEDFSTEFCGGCHVSNTKEIEYFLIKKEGSPGAGSRRIEAVCGSKVIDYFQEVFQTISSEINEHNLKWKETLGHSECSVNESVPVPEEVNSVFAKKKSGAVKIFREKRKHLEDLLKTKKEEAAKKLKEKNAAESSNLLQVQDRLISESEKIGNFVLIQYRTSGEKIENLKELGDSLKNRVPESLTVLLNEDKAAPSTLILMAGRKAVENKIQCNDLLKKILPLLDGRGGGKPDLAQGSVKSLENLNKAVEVLKEALNGSGSVV